MIEKSLLKKIIEEYGSPSFVFDEVELVDRVSKIKDIFSRDGRFVKLCYSIKANPFLIESLDSVIDNYEVCSPGELEICISKKVSPEKIIYSGVNKGIDDVKRAIDYGVGTLTAESVRHYQFIKKYSSEIRKKVSVILRLTSNSQFGMSEKDIDFIINDCLTAGADSFVCIDGIHYFNGTGRKKIEHQAKELRSLIEYIKALRDRFNIELPKLEYGPGLYHPYFEGEDFSDTLKPAKDLAPFLFDALDYCDLTVEMGRFFASSCGYYITEIVDIKESGEKKWCIADGGLNHVNYLGQMMGMKIPKLLHYSDGTFIETDEEDKEYCYTICGSLCTTNDVLIRDLKSGKLSINDFLIFRNIGAYSVTEGIGLFLSRTLPKIILCRENDCRVLRDFVDSWKINM